MFVSKLAFWWNIMNEMKWQDCGLIYADINYRAPLFFQTIQVPTGDGTQTFKFALSALEPNGSFDAICHPNIRYVQLYIPHNGG